MAKVVIVDKHYMSRYAEKTMRKYTFENAKFVSPLDGLIRNSKVSMPHSWTLIPVIPGSSHKVLSSWVRSIKWANIVLKCCLIVFKHFTIHARKCCLKRVFFFILPSTAIICNRKKLLKQHLSTNFVHFNYRINSWTCGSFELRYIHI